MSDKNKFGSSLRNYINPKNITSTNSISQTRNIKQDRKISNPVLANSSQSILGGTNPNTLEYITPPIASYATPPEQKENIIQNAGITLLPQEPTTQSTQTDDSDSRFLASLIGQGTAMLGAGIQGRSLSDVAEQFDYMRELDKRREYQKQQDEEKKLQQKKAQEQLNELTNPSSAISKSRRSIYSKALGIAIPEEFSASDLSDNTLVRGLQQQAEQARMANMPKTISGVKPEKEIKSNQKYLSEYREHVGSLSDMSDIMSNIKELNRTRLGALTPDISLKTQTLSTALDRSAQPMVKTLAGPGTLQPEERTTYGKLVPTGNTRSDLALEQAKGIIIDGTNKSLAKMNTDLATGDLNKRDYDALINQYNNQLTKKNMDVDRIINPDTGILEQRKKIERTLSNGKKIITDQFGYTWE